MSDRSYQSPETVTIASRGARMLHTKRFCEVPARIHSNTRHPSLVNTIGTIDHKSVFSKSMRHGASPWKSKIEEEREYGLIKPNHDLGFGWSCWKRTAVAIELLPLNIFFDFVLNIVRACLLAVLLGAAGRFLIPESVRCVNEIAIWFFWNLVAFLPFERQNR